MHIIEEAYDHMLTEYPDVLNAQQTAKILGVTRQHVYKMIDYGYFYGIKAGKSYCIPKLNIIRYLIGEAS